MGHNEKYWKTERKIHGVVNRLLLQRRRAWRVQEICRGAGIDCHTFYRHGEEERDILRRYERYLLEEFRRKRPHRVVNQEVFFRALMKFMLEHRDYFYATLMMDDSLILSQILSGARKFVKAEKVEKKNYIIYVETLVAVMKCWAKYDGMKEGKQEAYLKKLLQVRMLYYW